MLPAPAVAFRRGAGGRFALDLTKFGRLRPRSDNAWFISVFAAALRLRCGGWILGRLIGTSPSCLSKIVAFFSRGEKSPD
jgi:hypothetical protein